MAPNLATASLKATGSTQSRTLGDRLAEIVNVKDFGATGDGTTNDRAAIQAAIDAAFGTAGSPHGTSATLNRPLFFPNGTYNVDTSPLVFTQVRGGYIFGEGMNTTFVFSNGLVGSVVQTDGMEHCHFQNMSFGAPRVASKASFELDWSGSGSVGLEGNMFTNVAFSHGDYAIRIGLTGHGGAGTQFYGCNIGNANTVTAGLVTWSSGAIGTLLIGGGSASINGGAVSGSGNAVWVKDGQVCGVYEFSMSDNYTDIVVAVDKPILIKACRTESLIFVDVTNTAGLVVIEACDQQIPSGTSQFCIPAGTVGGAQAKVIIDACRAQATGNETLRTSTSKQGKVYVRACNLAAGFFTNCSNGVNITIAQNI